jgi:caa(3)-type oxidase subunit IV
MDHGQATARALPQQVHHGSEQGQQHPLGIYFAIWGVLFVLSAFSYAVDYFAFHGFVRWSLILLFMWLKAGLIVSVFMHMRWERSALMYAILVPPLLLAVLVGLMSMESNYTFWTRIIFFGFE